MSLHLLVLAGGSGTRLWPLSRSRLPKHLLPLAPSGKTLLRDTLERALSLAERVHVVTSAAQAERCLADLNAVGLGADAVIAEPVARGTGPALALAVASIIKDDPAALVASVHADHRISDPDAWRTAVIASAGWALATGGLATVGIQPTRPATAFGYIEIADPMPSETWTSPRHAPRPLVEEAAKLAAFTAIRFAEKPSAETAERYFAGGRHLWNLGLFAWPGAYFHEAVQRASPDLAESVARVVAAQAAGDEAAAEGVYAAIAPIPVEPLVFERAERFAVVKAAFAWSDLGSWADLHDARAAAGEADAAGNVTDGDALVLAGRRCTVEARGGRLVAVVGADDLVVVDTADAVLVVPSGQSQRVKEVVDSLRDAGRTELL